MADKHTNSREVVAARAKPAAATPAKTSWARPLLVTAGLTAGAWLLRRTLPGRIALGALKFAPLLLPLVAAKAVEQAEASEEAEPTPRRRKTRAAGKRAPRAGSGSAGAEAAGVG